MKRVVRIASSDPATCVIAEALGMTVVEEALADVVLTRPCVAPLRLADAFSNIRDLGRRLSAERAAQRLLEALEARTQRVRGRTLRLPPRRVLVIAALDPLTPAHGTVDDLVTIAGGTPTEHDPEVVVAAPLGYCIERTLRERARLPSHDELWIADGEVHFHFATPRLVDSLEILGCCLHPQAFPDLAKKRAAYFTRVR